MSADERDRYRRRVIAEGGNGSTSSRTAGKLDACGATVEFPDLGASLSLTVTPFGTWDLVVRRTVPAGDHGGRRTTYETAARGDVTAPGPHEE